MFCLIIIFICSSFFITEIVLSANYGENCKSGYGNITKISHALSVFIRFSFLSPKNSFQRARLFFYEVVDFCVACEVLPDVLLSFLFGLQSLGPGGSFSFCLLLDFRPSSLISYSTFCRIIKIEKWNLSMLILAGSLKSFIKNDTIYSLKLF